MPPVNGTASNDFIHVAGDGLPVPVGFTGIALVAGDFVL